MTRPREDYPKGRQKVIISSVAFVASFLWGPSGEWPTKRTHRFRLSHHKCYWKIFKFWKYNNFKFMLALDTWHPSPRKTIYSNYLLVNTLLVIVLSGNFLFFEYYHDAAYQALNEQNAQFFKSSEWYFAFKYPSFMQRKLQEITGNVSRENAHDG